MNFIKISRYLANNSFSINGLFVSSRSLIKKKVSFFPIAAYYIIFLSFDNPKTPDGIDDSNSNPMQSPVESIMAMFLISLSYFSDYYGAFEKTEHEYIAKLLFVIYMGIVGILLVNMLIAMMGNTYQKIAETRNEWQRQVRKIKRIKTNDAYVKRKNRNLRRLEK